MHAVVHDDHEDEDPDATYTEDDQGNWHQVENPPRYGEPSHEPAPLISSILSADGKFTLGLDEGTYPLRASCSTCGQSVICAEFDGIWVHAPLPSPK